MGYALPQKYPPRGIVAGQHDHLCAGNSRGEESRKSSLGAPTPCRDRVSDIGPKGASLRSHRARPTPAHRQPHRSRGEDAVVSSRVRLPAMP